MPKGIRSGRSAWQNSWYGLVNAFLLIRGAEADSGGAALLVGAAQPKKSAGGTLGAMPPGQVRVDVPTGCSGTEDRLSVVKRSEPDGAPGGRLTGRLTDCKLDLKLDMPELRRPRAVRFGRARARPAPVPVRRCSRPEPEVDVRRTGSVTLRLSCPPPASADMRLSIPEMRSDRCSTWGGGGSEG